MKKIVLFVSIIFCFAKSEAQDTTLKEYIGKYTFPAGSIIPFAEVMLRDTVLYINSAQGASDLVKQGRDTFVLVSFNGMVYFRRDGAGKVTGVKAEVGDVLLEGTKEPASAVRRKPLPHGRKSAAVR